MKSISSTELREIHNDGVFAALTHLPLDKMDAIFAADIFKPISVNENIIISIQISLKFVPKDLIDNKSALVQEVMKWIRIPSVEWFRDVICIHIIFYNIKC